MPTPIEQTIAIINSPDSKLRDITPTIYRMPDDLPENETRMRYLDQTACASKTIRKWLTIEYGQDWHMQTTQEDNSPIFALVREPKERWWSGVRSWMSNLPWYAWWQNKQLMEKFFPHFNRYTTSQSQILDQVKVDHYIKIDSNLDQRFTNFCRKHRLRQYGPLLRVKNHRYIDAEVKKMENKGRSQLESWIRQSPIWQEKLDKFLESDYKYWDKVKDQD